ncbi:hypothetical protein FH587_20060 [Leptospira interrogans]|uniref:hypothetical protein n=1 Tax=Leptospira interrogans TaxID=173 RepID=UPI001F084927|nr:hypothetical protein [Leptospira interrogans]UML84269.1 hypothetical protein FH587_19980 [Leptospira interrogans]UML84285.1 hypothetical protein FH587_20060 [Leptospira interrogans]
MNENKRTKERLRLLHPQVTEMEMEEVLFQERIETFWKTFEKMSSSQKRDEVKRLLATFHNCKKRIEVMIFQWKDLFEKDREVQRKLRVIGERMRG